eukprot:EC119339.1.p2 GENE.EC119339.1~~EC119339.1.p2  ORF type:complete len:124 (+),score=15.38 EC119339.1:140-511(+)
MACSLLRFSAQSSFPLTTMLSDSADWEVHRTSAHGLLAPFRGCRRRTELAGLASVSEVGSSGALGNVSSNGAGKSNGTAPTEEYKPKVYGNSPFLTFKNIANPGKLPMGAPRPYKPGKEIFKK